MKQKKEFQNEELKEIRHEKSSENEEMYLKVIFILEEDGINPVCSNYVAKTLKIALPSVVEMLAKMDKKDLIKYNGRKGISFKPKGKKIAKRIVRNLRLMELLLKEVLKIQETKCACKFEHCLGEETAEAVNKLLKNPVKCPHGKTIPKI
jgi:DtxR family Mn-dependent transcriptional regulator